MTVSKINNILLALIIAVNLYVVAAPLAPQVIYWWQQHHTQRQQQLEQQLKANPVAVNNHSTTPAVAQPNHVVIPSMLLDQPIYEGSIRDTYKILDKGIWRWPNGSTPDKGGNTVLIGHRFTYTQPKGVLYFLNKVQLGDEIGVFWQNQKYIYKVTSITVVPPTEISVESPTPDARLTIFTCTPLWLPKDRLVVVAELETT